MNLINTNAVSFLEIKSASSSGQAESHLRVCKPPFLRIINEVRSTIEVDCFSPKHKKQAEEICLIIAEVFSLPSDAKVRINGNDISAEMVAVIYQRLAHEHVKLVIDNFDRVSYEIKYKKTYLRTALYNAVFEFESHWENQVSIDFGGK